MTHDLHMAQLELDVSALMRDARDHGWLIRQPTSTGKKHRDWDDPGHLVHHKLAALFGDVAPKPFRILSAGEKQRGRWLQLLGYTALDASQLRQRAEEFALPTDQEACRLETLRTKPMPDSLFQPERHLGFELRACPVVRLNGTQTIQWEDGPETFGPGAELDAYFHRRYIHGDKDLDRQAVYLDWLHQRLERAGGANITEGRLHAFRRVRIMRRKHRGDKRPTRVSERPDALLKGTLKVTDGAAFRRLVTHGIGRHKGFGFGMLLLRPVT
ncbi:MAG: type I-E CRISPR-associated protein Cas6/Cse3/CasE [Acidobacteriota bacterium]